MTEFRKLLRSCLQKLDLQHLKATFEPVRDFVVLASLSDEPLGLNKLIALTPGEHRVALEELDASRWSCLHHSDDIDGSSPSMSVKRYGYRGGCGC